MGVKIEITKVNKESSFVSFTQDGQSKTVEVVAPAQIKWARFGKAEVGFSPEGKINFVRSLEPKPATVTNNSWSNAPKKRQYTTINSVEIAKGITLDEFKVIYNEMSAKQNIKVNATNYLNQITDAKGKFTFDAVLFYTQFEKIDEGKANTSELMGDGEQVI